MRVSAIRRRIRATAALVLSVTLSSSALVACGSSDNGVSAKSVPSESTVLADDIAVSSSLLDAAEAVVVSSAGVNEQRRAAGIAVAAGLPMLVAGSVTDAEEEAVATSPKKDARGHDTGADIAEVEKEVQRLGASTVLTVGAVDWTGGDSVQVIADPGTDDGLKDLVGVDFELLKKPESESGRAIAEMDAAKPSVVDSKVANEGTASPEKLDDANVGKDDKAEGSPKLPTSTPKASKKALALAAPGTGLAAIATARAAGLNVDWLPVGDARATSESIAAARKDKTLIGLGSVFGSKEKFAKTIDLAKDDKVAELPGGGTLLFPGRHFVATYGHPGAETLGVMGEDEPEDAVARAQEYVEQYEELVDDPVLPAFEIIGSVAQADPGPRGDYSEPAEIETL